MKLRLSVGQLPYSGYINVDPVPRPPENGLQSYCRDFKTLDDLVETAECTEILVEEIIDHIHTNELPLVIEYWVSKLRHGGKIVITGTDLYEVCRLYLTGRITTQECNQVLHGGNENIWQQKHGQLNLRDLTVIITNLGLKITRKELDGVKFLLEAVRE